MSIISNIIPDFHLGLRTNNNEKTCIAENNKANKKRKKPVLKPQNTTRKLSLHSSAH